MEASSRWLDVLDEVDRLDLPVLTVRYEDLCADVHGCLHRALEHAGLDPDRFPVRRRTANRQRDQRAPDCRAPAE